jgi:hypothetical protein
MTSSEAALGDIGHSRATVSDGLIADGLTRKVAEMCCDMWESQGAANLAPEPDSGAISASEVGVCR